MIPSGKVEGVSGNVRQSVLPPLSLPELGTFRDAGWPAGPGLGQETRGQVRVRVSGGDHIPGNHPRQGVGQALPHRQPEMGSLAACSLGGACSDRRNHENGTHAKPRDRKES